MMMTLVHALLQPNCSLFSINNRENYPKRHFATENPDRGPKTTIVMLNNNVTEHVVKASTEVAYGKDTKYKTYKQHAVKRHKIHISTESDVSKVSKIKTINEENVIEETQVKLHKRNIQNKQRYKKDSSNLNGIIDVINMIQLDNLIILLKKKVYLYLISQILNYNYIMEAYDNTIYANWKINTETYDTTSKYFRILSTNRKYFTTWKLMLLIMKDMPVFKEIVWHLSENDEEYEERIETTKIKQEGIKIILYWIDGNLNYVIIGMVGTKVKLNTEVVIKYVEILDLIKSNNEYRPLPIENNKFNKRILNIDRDIWIKSGEIIAKNCIKEVWYVTKNCVILCKESNDELNKEINGHTDRKDKWKNEANANAKRISDDENDSK